MYYTSSSYQSPWELEVGGWELEVGSWRLGVSPGLSTPNSQLPIPNSQRSTPKPCYFSRTLSVSGAVSLIVTGVPAGIRTSSPFVERTTAVPAPPPIAAPFAAPLPPPMMPPITAPAPAPTPIFVASFRLVVFDAREYVAVLTFSWPPSPGKSMLLMRKAIDAT